MQTKVPYAPGDPVRLFVHDTVETTQAAVWSKDEVRIAFDPSLPVALIQSLNTRRPCRKSRARQCRLRRSCSRGCRCGGACSTRAFLGRVLLEYASDVVCNSYPPTVYHRERSCWVHYAPLIAHFALRPTLVLHLVQHLLAHKLVTQPQLREIVRAVDREVERVEEGGRDGYDEWRRKATS